MQAAIDPLMPANVKTYMAESHGKNSYLYNGNFVFTMQGNNRATKADKMEFMPRVGLAFKLDNKTALRVGYGRFFTPNSLIMPDRDANGELPLGAFSPSTTANPLLSGIPQAYLANPFPQGLTPAYGKSYNRYTQLGDAITIDKYEQRPPISDRINFSIQRELPGRFVLDVTYLMNFVSRDQWTKQLNLMDPRFTYKYGAALSATVSNPFYSYGTISTFPGALRKQAKVTIGSLLVPYPQYGALLQTSTVKKIGEVGAGKYWFDVTGFTTQPAYTRRTNPWYYDGLTGPGYKNLDLSIFKRVKINERYQVEARLESYNAINGMNWANPTVDVSKSDFGRTNAQASGYYGRQLQVAGKFYF
jgi:hypothetical protein